MYKWNKANWELKNGNNQLVRISKCGQAKIWKWEGGKYQVDLLTCWFAREDGIESWDFIHAHNENEGFETLHEAKVFARGAAPDHCFRSEDI
jgi:hypothetical protein